MAMEYQGKVLHREARSLLEKGTRSQVFPTVLTRPGAQWGFGSQEQLAALLGHPCLGPQPFHGCHWTLDIEETGLHSIHLSCCHDNRPAIQKPLSLSPAPGPQLLAMSR